MPHIIDIFILIILLYAFWRGWSSGILAQISGIFGLVLGVWLSYKFGDTACEYLKLEGWYRTLFLIGLIILTLVLTSILSRLLTKLLDFSGLSFGVKFLGAIFSVIKYMLSLSLLLLFINWLHTLHIFSGIDIDFIEDTYFYKPLTTIGSLIYPYLDQLISLSKDSINNIDSSSLIHV